MAKEAQADERPPTVFEVGEDHVPMKIGKQWCLVPKSRAREYGWRERPSIGTCTVVKVDRHKATAQ